MPEPITLSEGFKQINQREKVFDTEQEFYESLMSLSRKGLILERLRIGMQKIFLPIPDNKDHYKVYCQAYGKIVTSCEQVSNIHDNPMMCGPPGCRDIGTMLSTKYEPVCHFHECVLQKDLQKHRYKLDRTDPHF
jgi:hypothetical protein